MTGEVTGRIFAVLAVFGFLASPILESSAGKYRTPMHKVLLTQKGYIQFLRWELPVPPIEEFTFCVWVKSYNLTYSHSIFSYSKDEKDRLVRAWIAPHGKSMHLEIGGVEVFRRPTRIREHRWYHICQSWENQNGRYALWIDGRVEVQGLSKRTIDHIIPSNGDIVLGQEYTDFDKGLEEGIEGAVFGFNLLLSSAFNALDRSLSSSTYDRPSNPIIRPDIFKSPFDGRIPMEIMASSYQSHVSYHSNSPIFGISRKARKTRRAFCETNDPIEFDRRIDIEPIGKEPLGQQLIRLTYVHCQIGRGSPNIGGPRMLISWSRTPVRVFGGATLKNANEVCGDF